LPRCELPGDSRYEKEIETFWWDARVYIDSRCLYATVSRRLLYSVADSRGVECGLRYVIFSQAEKRKKLFARSACSEWLDLD
jgi:hypothetical protein